MLAGLPAAMPPTIGRCLKREMPTAASILGMPLQALFSLVRMELVEAYILGTRLPFPQRAPFLSTGVCSTMIAAATIIVGTP